MQTIVRTIKNGRWFSADREVYENPRISLKAKGIHAYLISRPPDWQIHVSQLPTICADGKHAVRMAMNELIQAGYAKRDQIRRKNGTWQTVEILVRDSLKTPWPGEPLSENRNPAELAEMAEKNGKSANPAKSTGFQFSASGKSDTTNKDNTKEYISVSGSKMDVFKAFPEFMLFKALKDWPELTRSDFGCCGYTNKNEPLVTLTKQARQRIARQAGPRLAPQNDLAST